MCGKRSTKNQEEYNLTLNFTDEGDEPDYLSMIESISYDVEECGLLFEIIPDQESLLSLSDFLFLSLENTALFSVLAELSLHDDVTIDMLAKFFKCKIVRILSLLDQIEALEKRGFVKRIVKTEIRKETYRDLSFTVPKNVMEALRTANPGLLEANRKLDFPDLALADVGQNRLKSHKAIREKTLYFNAEVGKRIVELEKLLGRKEFIRYRESAARLGMSHGITAIFFGPPGTGKTELALQIARKTQRDLMMVDLSQTRSMWFGESEKQVKRIFDHYRELLVASQNEPILFINEADGLLSHRLDISRGSHSVSHTENTIQNILLEELENFRGILIATTNLTRNLDKAFERRFLLKIDFSRPDETVRQQIWLSKLPELTPEMAETLARRFDFSGGQIDNQVKQLLIKRVLHPDADLLQTLIESCEKELGFSERKPIGFS
jgi:AAA+ superfamily predicted ATPase